MDKLQLKKCYLLHMQLFYQFVEEELNIKEKERVARRQKIFHDVDQLISVDDLWHRWINSEGTGSSKG